jgi:hypothetical protein
MRISTSLNFILANFMVSAMSDLFLNYLSRVNSVHMPKPILALESYFKHYDNAILTAIYAGLTVLAALILTMFLAKFIWGFTTPVTIPQLLRFLSLAIPLGYIADVLIYKYKVFGVTLDPYYKAAGSGFYGALAFVFSIVFSYIWIKSI